MPKSKLGPYVISAGATDLVDWFRNAQPAVAVSMDHNPETWRAVKAVSPGTFIVGRFYMDDVEQGLTDHPVERAEYLFDAMYDSMQAMKGIYSAWMSLNEPVINNNVDALALSKFHCRWGDLMKLAGIKSVAYNFATGNPELEYVPLLAEGLRHCDYLGLHEYDAPEMNRTPLWLCLRYRQFVNALPADARRPVIIDECGIDGGPIGQAQWGWRHFGDETHYLASLKWYDQELQKDNYVLGGSIFALSGWGNQGSFSIVGANQIRDYIGSEGAPSNPPPPTPPPATEAFVEGVDLSHYQGLVNFAELARTKAFAFIKVTEALSPDSAFSSYWSQAKAAGILRGGYHFYRFRVDPVEQAAAFCSALGNDPGELYPVVDVEDTTAQGDNYQLASFITEIKKRLGVPKVILYTARWYWDGADYWKRYFKWTLDTPLWVCDMGPARISPILPSDWTDWMFWQYGQAENVPGITGKVDLDRFKGTLDQLKAIARTPAPEPKPEPKPEPQPETPPVTPTTVPADPRLAAYPRPKDDNGIGIHFRLNLKQTDNQPLVDQGVAWAKELKVKWALVAGQDWNQILTAASRLWTAGIMPVCRLICKIDGPADFVTGVAKLKASGIPAYIQIYNEPGDDREWRNSPNIGKFGAKWAQAAIDVYDAGGYPGLQVLGKDEFDNAIGSLRVAGRMDVLQKAWFCLHNYGSNHPANYPYDALNQRDHPGDTIVDDGTAVLRFLEYKQWMMDALGFCLPFIGGEGGWEWGCLEDNRYPKLSAEDHARLHVEMFSWFRTGVLSNGERLPDELFSVAPWIMADWGADDWFGGPLGVKQQTIDAVKALPTFTRAFGEGVVIPPPPPPTPPPDPEPEPEPEPADGFTVTVVPNAATFSFKTDFLEASGSPQASIARVIIYDNHPSDDPVSESGVKLMAVVRDPRGMPLDGELVTLKWPGGQSAHATRNGYVSFDMSGDSNFDPNKNQKGPYTLHYLGAVAGNFGLPMKQHVEFLVHFERK